MAKKNCELCGKLANDNDMRFGVWLCQECIQGYRDSMDGNIEAHKYYSNPQNFPNATDKAIKEILSLIASKKPTVPKLQPQPQPQPITQQSMPVNTVSYPTYHSTTYQQPNVAYQQPQPYNYVSTQPSGTNKTKFSLDSLYKDIGKKLKNWAKWIFIIEAISSVIGALAMIFSEDDVLLVVGFVMIFAGPLIAWVSSWLLYAFGELVDKTCESEKNTRENEKNTREILNILKEANQKKN